MSKSAIRNTRRKKVADDIKPQTKAKFLEVAMAVEVQQQIVPKFVPANSNQKIAVAMLREGKSVVFLTGSAGSGKSMIAAFHAATQLKAKKVDKIYLVRPAVSCGKSLGSLPGTVDEKLAPYFAQTTEHLSKFMGEGFMTYCLEKKIIEMQPVEYLRGRSFENCIVICEEIQGFTFAEIEMMLTRLGKNCTYILTGDQKQNDLRGQSGLESTIALLDRMKEQQPDYLSDDDLTELDSKIGIVRFTPDDVVRSGITRAFVKMYHHN